MLPEKHVQPHMVKNVVAYPTEQCPKDPSKKRMIPQETKPMSQADQLLKKGILCKEIMPLLPSLLIIEQADYHGYMQEIYENVGILTMFENIVKAYVSEAATLDPDDCDNVPMHMKELDKTFASQIRVGSGLAESVKERICRMLREKV